MCERLVPFLCVIQFPLWKPCVTGNIRRAQAGLDWVYCLVFQHNMIAIKKRWLNTGVGENMRASITSEIHEGLMKITIYIYITLHQFSTPQCKPIATYTWHPWSINNGITYSWYVIYMHTKYTTILCYTTFCSKIVLTNIFSIYHFSCTITSAEYYAYEALLS